MRFKVGDRVSSQVSDVELIVTIGNDIEVALCCADVPMVMTADLGERQPLPAGDVEIAGVLLGKRYRSPEADFEVLVVRAGDGPLSIDGQRLEPAKAKELPSSD